MNENEAPQTYTLKLNGLERVILFDTIPARASPAKVMICAYLRDKLKIEPAEMADYGLKQVPVGGGQFSVECAKKEERSPIEFTAHEMELLVALCQEYDRWPTSMDSVHLIGQLSDITGRAIIPVE